MKTIIIHTPPLLEWSECPDNWFDWLKWCWKLIKWQKLFEWSSRWWMLSISVSPFKRSEWLGKWSEWFKWCWQRNVGGRVISTPALRPRSTCTQSSSSTSKSKIGLKNFIFYRNQPILYHINYLFLIIFHIVMCFWGKIRKNIKFWPI